MLKFAVDECLTSYQYFGSGQGGPGEFQPQMKFTAAGLPGDDSLYLPAPVIGSSEQYLGANMVALSRSQEPNTIKIGKLYYKFDWTFNGLYEKITEEAFDFFYTKLGLEYKVTDHRDYDWDIIVSKVPEIIQNGKDIYSFLLEAEGLPS